MDGVYRTRSLGVATEGIPDQYSDGRAAKVWELYIGQKENRTRKYREWLINTLERHGCKTVLDVACGTGVDSIMLVEAGFKVYSVDASDKMLKFALKERWNRRHETGFDEWVIEEANWLTLPDDIGFPGPEANGYDAVLCIGNSFAHLPDFEGNSKIHQLAIKNFHKMLSPGGLLLIDHRNYDEILDEGTVPKTNIYYESPHIKDIKTSILHVDGRASMVTLDYSMNMEVLQEDGHGTNSSSQHYSILKRKTYDGPALNHFRLSYYPHRLASFNKLLRDEFTKHASHEIYGDFKLISDSKQISDRTDPPAFYIHIIRKDR